MVPGPLCGRWCYPSECECHRGVDKPDFLVIWHGLQFETCCYSVSVKCVNETISLFFLNHY